MNCFLSTCHLLLILIPFEEPPHLTADLDQKYVLLSRIFESKLSDKTFTGGAGNVVPTCRFTTRSSERAESERTGMSSTGILGECAAGFVGRRLLSWQISWTKPENRDKSSLGPAPRENAQTLGPGSPR